jgi:hypothetical protein
MLVGMPGRGSCSAERSTVPMRPMCGPVSC